MVTDYDALANGIYAAAQRYVDETIDQLVRFEREVRSFSQSMVDFMHPFETEKMKRYLSNNYAKMHGIPMQRKLCEERRHIHGRKR